jgi:small subunit ribosomal protein S1
MGTFSADGVYSPRTVTSRDIDSSFEEEVERRHVSLKEKQLVSGSVVKIDRDAVYVDVRYKTEGIIPVRELAIKNDVDPNDIVAIGDQIEALVVTLEDAKGNLILSKKRAQYEKAWGTIERVKESDGTVKGTVIEVVKGGLIVDIGLRGFLPASLVELRRVRDLQPYIGKEVEAKIIELDRNGIPRGDPPREARPVPREPEARRGPGGRDLLGRRVRRVRQPRRHGRPHPR